MNVLITATTLEAMERPPSATISATLDVFKKATMTATEIATFRGALHAASHATLFLTRKLSIDASFALTVRAAVTHSID